MTKIEIKINLNGSQYRTWTKHDLNSPYRNLENNQSPYAPGVGDPTPDL